MPNRFLKGSGATYPIIINESNLVSTPNNNIYEYSFPAGSVRLDDCSIAVQSIQMYYSWFNITAARQNNEFKFIHPVAAGYNTYTVTIPDGYYSILGLNAYLQNFLIANNLYLQDAAGDNVYYLEIVENPTIYAVQFNAYIVPIALPGGWTDPSGAFSFPLVSETPQLIVTSTNFRDLIGFNAGTYPAGPSAVNYSKASDYTPQVSPVSSVLLNCNLLENYYANPQTLLYSFTSTGTAFGGLLDIKPPEYTFVKVQTGSFWSIRIEFTDQLFRALPINDSNLVVTLLIRHDESTE